MKRWYFLSPLILQKIIWIPTRFVLWFFGHLEIKGIENLDGLESNVIFACNHTSEMDPFMIPASLTFFSHFSPTFYTSRESKYYQNSGWRKHFYGGYFFKAWGSYPVKAGLSDYEKSLHHHIRILNDGGNLCYFPEGHITPDGNIQKAHGGIAYLAEYCGRPIVPVAIVGLYKISMEDLFSRRRKVAISFGLPIYQKELREEVARKTVPGQHVYKEEAEYVMKKVGKMLVEVCYFH